VIPSGQGHCPANGSIRDETCHSEEELAGRILTLDEPQCCPRPKVHPPVPGAGGYRRRPVALPECRQTHTPRTFPAGASAEGAVLIHVATAETTTAAAR